MNRTAFNARFTPSADSTVYEFKNMSKLDGDEDSRNLNLLFNRLKVNMLRNNIGA